MKRLKSILRWTIGLLLGGYLLISVLFSLPPIQHWIGGMVSDALSDYLQTRVEVGRVKLGVPLRLIVDDIHAFDRQGREMLRVARAGAKLDIIPLLREKEIRINNALLFGAHADVYQEHPDSALNCQFVIDAFKKREQKDTPMPHLSIGSILVRHATVRFDQQWKPRKKSFDPAHVSVRDLSLAAQLHILTDDTLSVTLRRLSFTEENGLRVKAGQAHLARGCDGFVLSDFLLCLPGSNVDIPELAFSPQDLWAKGQVKTSFTLADAQAFRPELSGLTNPVSASFSFAIDTLQAIVKDLGISTQDDALALDIPSLEIRNLKTTWSRIREKESKPLDRLPDLDVQLNKLQVSPAITDYITPFTNKLPAKAVAVLEALGESELKGTMTCTQGEAQCDLNVRTQQGGAALKGSIHGQHVKGRFSTDGFDAGHLLQVLQAKGETRASAKATSGEPNTTPAANRSTAAFPLGRVALNAEADIILPEKGKIPTGSITASIAEAHVKNHTYRDIHLTASHHRDDYDVALHSADPAITLDLTGQAHLSDTYNKIQAVLEVPHFRPIDLSLTQAGIQEIDTKIGVDLAGETLDNLAGEIYIPHINLSDEQGEYIMGRLTLKSKGQGQQRDITFQSPYLRASAKGAFNFSDLLRYGQNTIHSWIPGIVDAPTIPYNDCDARFSLTLTDLEPLQRITGIPLKLPDGPLRLNAEADSRHEELSVEASVPTIGFKDMVFQDFSFATRSQGKKMTTTVHANKSLRDTPFDLDVNISAEGEYVSTSVDWSAPDDGAKNNGSIAFRANMKKEPALSIEGSFLPTTILINDTVWNVQPTRLTFKDGTLNIQDFRLTMNDGQRWLAINGQASKSEQDTLHIDLQDIELAYIFDLARVKPLKLGGLATGTVVGTSLFSSARAKADIRIPDLLFNNAEMGACHGQLTWETATGNLNMDIRIDDLPNRSWVNANGYLHLLKDPVQSLNLNFLCQRVNSHFVERYVNGIMKDIQGRTSGTMSVSGKFGEVDLCGEADVEEAALTVPMMNVRYHVRNEHVSIKPEGIFMKGVTVYDPQGDPDVPDHRGTVDGEISFRHFRDMKYDIKISGENILAYNFPDFDDLPFCGVVYGTGGVHVHGYPGMANIDIDARPTKGTVLTYKVASPETITQSDFITFRSHDFSDQTDRQEKTPEDTQEGDMHMNFNLDITSDAELRLLMDPAAGDYITIRGNAPLKAKYFNKDKFSMFGIYTVEEGTYKMSIQNAIRKEFQFSKGGTITFQGNPFDADLALQAVYTVPSVSLNDLSARGTFSNTNVRVNCLMNLGGKAGAPQITFDFDIPNVNEDELRMVRSLISTEEERNLQVIYLLGIGRFYTYDYTGTQTQSSTALNSLLSTTLSGQFNQMFTTLMGGNQNWNIGANLSTGELGWSDIDVEGKLSGRLLDNRLLINGNFGYQDNPMATTNFIGDFDLQWMLNKPGNFVLKAYSETNDRYFTKSSLTTQGVGLLAKKDFSRWTDLFRWAKRKKNKTAPSY